jgi:phosphoglycolate phosphatase
LKQTIILFDLDGTLLDSTEAILLCFEDSYADFGEKAPKREKIKSLIGHPLDFMYEHLGVEKNRVLDFVDRYKFYYRKRSKEMTHFLPNAKESIIEAAKFARLGVVTTKTGSYSIELLKHMGVMGYFEVLIGRENVTHPKPHPEPILKALHQMDVTNCNGIWMVGDTCLDMVSGKDAGVQTIGVSCGYGTLEQLQRCTSVIKSDTKSAILHIKKHLTTN